MKVAFIGKNSGDRYSGGRIHAWVMAHAFAFNKWQVDFYTNNMPVFAKDFKQFPENAKLNVRLNKFFIFLPTIKYKLIVVVPHLASKKSIVVDKFLFYPLVKLFKKRSSCALWYLDFESPNWINEVLPGVRPINAYKYSNNILPFVNAIISTTKIGRKYAEEYYGKFNTKLIYMQLYLAINSIAAETVNITIKENKAVYFARFGERNKNTESIVNVLKCLPVGFKLVMIGAKENVPELLFKQMQEEADSRKIVIEFLNRISDVEKFEAFASSKLLIYSSSFEGYGLPPVESQYMGTPVVCSNLPVLREVNNLAEFVNFDNVLELQHSINKVLEQSSNTEQLKSSVVGFAKFENYSYNLNTLTKSFFE